MLDTKLTNKTNFNVADNIVNFSMCFEALNLDGKGLNLYLCLGQERLILLCPTKQPHNLSSVINFCSNLVT